MVWEYLVWPDSPGCWYWRDAGDPPWSDSELRQYFRRSSHCGLQRHLSPGSSRHRQTTLPPCKDSPGLAVEEVVEVKYINWILPGSTECEASGDICHNIPQTSTTSILMLVISLTGSDPLTMSRQCYMLGQFDAFIVLLCIDNKPEMFGKSGDLLPL